MAYQNQQRRPPRHAEFESYLKKHIADILNFNHSDNLNELITNIKAYVGSIGRDIKTHQLRNIFQKVRACKTKTELQLLRPKLAYVAARQGSRNAKEMVEFFDFIIEKVTKDEQVKDFQSFFEAVVAYHKYHFGG